MPSSAYHLVLEGLVFNSGQHALLGSGWRTCRCPDSSDGVELVARDERWHVGLGVRVLQERGLDPRRRGARGRSRPALAVWGDEEYPAVKVVILTTFEQDDYIFGAISAGASGFLLKRTAPEELIAAIHSIAAGDSLLSPSVTSRVIESVAQRREPDADHGARLAELTPREHEVLGLVARGLSNGEIATELVIEESTVKTHLKRILPKIGARDRVHAVIFAYESGLAEGGS